MTSVYSYPSGQVKNQQFNMQSGMSWLKNSSIPVLGISYIKLQYQFFWVAIVLLLERNESKQWDVVLQDAGHGNIPSC